MTDANGVATLSGVSVANFPTGISPGSVIATFAGDALDSPATAYGLLTVNRATPSITWPDPADITFGTQLDSTQLDAMASVPGSFVYTPGDGTILTPGKDRRCRRRLPPTTPRTTLPVTATTTINVLPAAPTVNWADPADITFGTQLSSTQLDATASVPGDFDYTPDLGTVLALGKAKLCR